jgi:D-alanine-D-alanine ligase
MRDAEVVFPVLHGGFGENGELQKILEDSKLKFVGCGSEACFWIFDKVKSKKIMLDSNLPTPPYAVFNSADAEFPETLSLPLVVKPANEGSTVGISLVSNKDVWQTALAEAMKYDSKVLVEQYVEGVEITVGVVDGTPLPPVEIQFPGKMYDYDAKYTHSKGETRYLCPPERLSEELQKKAMEIAEAFYKAFKVSDMVRVDMIVDTEENIWILEGNNLPGFTPDSLLPKAAKAAGYSFTELCAKLVASHL